MTRYTTDPSTWSPPDDVDAIQSAERWEQTDDHATAAIEWANGDADMLAEIADRFATTAAYDRAYLAWMTRGQLG